MQAFGTSVCTMASSDLLNLGNIAVALPVTSINCLPLEEDDTVASFGALSEWTTEQVFRTPSVASGFHTYGFQSITWIHQFHSKFTEG